MRRGFWFKNFSAFHGRMYGNPEAKRLTAAEVISFIFPNRVERGVRSVEADEGDEDA